MPSNSNKFHLVVKPEPVSRIGRAERARAEILNAAFEFLWSHSYRDLTVDVLMAKVPIGRSAFYRYFKDISSLMEAMLDRLKSEIFEGVYPWLTDGGDPIALLHKSLAAEVQLCYRHGPFIKAVADAAGFSANIEDQWNWFLDDFDDAVSKRIAEDQALGLIESFDPRLVAMALNRTSASMYVRLFGQKPRNRPEPVLDAISRVWISTLYGAKWATSRTSTLVRK